MHPLELCETLAGMDEDAICAQLDAALLSDDEMKQYAAIYGGKMWSSKIMELVGSTTTGISV